MQMGIFMKANLRMIWGMDRVILNSNFKNNWFIKKYLILLALKETNTKDNLNKINLMDMEHILSK